MHTFECCTVLKLTQVSVNIHTLPLPNISDMSMNTINKELKICVEVIALHVKKFSFMEYKLYFTKWPRQIMCIWLSLHSEVLVKR